MPLDTVLVYCAAGAQALRVKPTTLSDWAKAQDWIWLASNGKAA